MKTKSGFTIIEMLVCIFLFSCVISISVPLTNKMASILKNSVSNEISLTNQLFFYQLKLQLACKNINIDYYSALDFYQIDNDDIEIKLKINEKVMINQESYDFVCVNIFVDDNVLVVIVKMNNQEIPYFIRGEINEVYNY